MKFKQNQITIDFEILALISPYLKKEITFCRQIVRYFVKKVTNIAKNL